MIMRFKITKFFPIDELLLDENNYRFKAADDQKECIRKILEGKEKNFKEIMTSIARDGLSDLLLVFQENGKNIVLDGNRRLAALKVLNEPALSSSVSVERCAEELRRERTLNFDDILTQISSDKTAILKTVGERHAAGGGKSQIKWDAYANARFRYDEKHASPDDWKAIALLLELEQRKPDSDAVRFIDDNNFKYSVFKPIISKALSKGIISNTIFSDRDQRIKKTADAYLLEDNLKKIESFILSMKIGEISFAGRNQNKKQAADNENSKDFQSDKKMFYASGQGIDDYLDKFSKTPDKQLIENITESKSLKDSSGYTPKITEPKSNVREKGKRNGIKESEKVKKVLYRLDSDKLKNLYNSLCVVSLKEHSILLYVGAWSFFECLGRLLAEKQGKQQTTSFDKSLMSQLNAVIQKESYSKEQKRDIEFILKRISIEGNCNKHSSSNFSETALQLRTDFNTLEFFILDIIDLCIKKKEEYILDV